MDTRAPPPAQAGSRLFLLRCSISRIVAKSWRPIATSHPNPAYNARPADAGAASLNPDELDLEDQHQISFDRALSLSSVTVLRRYNRLDLVAIAHQRHDLLPAFNQTIEL